MATSYFKAQTFTVLESVGEDASGEERIRSTSMEGWLGDVATQGVISADGHAIRHERVAFIEDAAALALYGVSWSIKPGDRMHASAEDATYDVRDVRVIRRQRDLKVDHLEVTLV